MRLAISLLARESGHELVGGLVQLGWSVRGAYADNAMFLVDETRLSVAMCLDCEKGSRSAMDLAADCKNTATNRRISYFMIVTWDVGSGKSVVTNGNIKREAAGSQPYRTAAIDENRPMEGR